MEKRKQRDERKEAGRRQKGGYKRNAKEIASSNIQTQNRVYEDHHGPKIKGVGNSLCLFCNIHLLSSVDHILWECKETEDQRTNMKKEQWINEKKGMEKIIDYAKEIGLYNGI
jgi:hypothetical protein